MVLRDPEAFQLLADETRRKILYLLRVKEMNVCDIAEELGLTCQAVYHHIRKLLKGKMIEVAREQRTGHIIESYYRATAEDFLLTHGKIDAKSIRGRKQAEEEVTAVLAAFKKLGLSLDYDEDKIKQIVDLRVKLFECCPGPRIDEIKDKIWSMDDLNILSKMTASDFIGTVLMSDKEFEQQQENRKELRKLLLTLMKEQTHTPAIKTNPPRKRS